MRSELIDHGGSRRWRRIIGGFCLMLAYPVPLVSGAGGGEPGTTDVVTVSASEFAVMADPRLTVDEFNTRLAAAGFSTVKRIPGLPPRYGTYRLVEVASVDAETKNKLAAIDGVLTVRPVYRSGTADYPILPTGRVVVRFKPGTTMAQVQAIADKYQCKITRQIDGLTQAYVFANRSRHMDMEIAGLLAGESTVRYSHPSLLFKLQKHAQEPILDPLFPFQWHLHNTGQLPGGVPGADVKAVEAWEHTLGAGATVAVIDDSVQKDHEDLKDNYVGGRDFLGSTPTFLSLTIDELIAWLLGESEIDITDDDPDPSPFFGPDPWFYDPLGDFHGTCVSGLICARPNNVGVRGVAPLASLVGIKIGLGYLYTTDVDVADAFRFAESSGAMVINNSWGGPGGALLPVVPSNSLLLPTLISDMVTTVATTGNGGRGCLVLFSAGNESIPISYGNVYASLPNVMSIGATLRDDLITCYSNYGPEQSVVAPGGGFNAPRDYGGGLPGVGCYDYDIATTDNFETQGYLSTDIIYPDPLNPNSPTTPQYAPGYLIRGLNPAMKFLDVATYYAGPNCVSSYSYTYCVPLVLDLQLLNPDFPDQNYTRQFDGTSAACPIASGVAALAYSINPSMTAVQARNLIEHTADKIQAPNERFDPVTGHNERYGQGRVNALRAVEAAIDGKSWPSPVKNVQNISSQSLIRLLWSLPDWDNDGNADIDVSGILVVRGAIGVLDWAPTDGVNYLVGDQVAPGVVVVANSLIDSLDQTGLSQGSYDYAIFVYNAEYYYSWGRRTSFSTIGSISVPEASISVSPMAGRAPLAVHFAGGATDATGVKNLSYRWDFGDGTVGFGAAVDHIYTSPGEYFPQLTVVNTQGQYATTTTRIAVSMRANTAPTAYIVADQTRGEVPLVVKFTGQASDIDGTIVRYEWSFGDGSTGLGQAIEHTYVSPGTYGVTLKVVDNQGGMGTASALISATAASTTAAETDPAGILENNTATALCGSGVPMAAMAVMFCLSILGISRRRK